MELDEQKLTECERKIKELSMYDNAFLYTCHAIRHDITQYRVCVSICMSVHPQALDFYTFFIN